MKKHFKLLTLLFTVMFCFAAFTLSVWAIDADGDGFDDETGEYIGGGEVVDPDPVYTDPDPAYTEPEPVYTDPEPIYTDPVYTEPDPYDPGDNNYEEPDYNYTSPPIYYEEPSYLGGGQSYVPPESTAPSVPLIDTDDNIDVKELSGKDWDDIAAKLKNAGSISSDGDDFSFIQKNTSTDDNGHWLLILGIALVVLSVAGFTYIIWSGVLRHKKLAVAGGAPLKNGAPSHYRSNNDYGDGFKESEKENKKKTDKSRKFDTADVKLPKRSGGKRYK